MNKLINIGIIEVSERFFFKDALVKISGHRISCEVPCLKK